MCILYRELFDSYNLTHDNMQKVYSLQQTTTWVYAALARPAKRQLWRMAAVLLRSRSVSTRSRSRQDTIAPSMEQFRKQSAYKNTTTAYGKLVICYRWLGYGWMKGYRYYGLSIILGTVALSYGSVPMYKMVSRLSDWHHPFFFQFLRGVVHYISSYQDSHRYANKPAGAASP